MVYSLPPVFPHSEVSSSQTITPETPTICQHIASAFHRSITSLQAYVASFRECLFGRPQNWERVVEVVEQPDLVSIPDFNTVDPQDSVVPDAVVLQPQQHTYASSSAPNEEFEIVEPQFNPPPHLLSLQTQITTFANICNSAGNEELEVLERAYRELGELFIPLFQQLIGSANEISKKYGNDEGLDEDPEFLFVLNLQAQLHRARRSLTDRLVTKYPHANIDYGALCVSPKLHWSQTDLAKYDALTPYRIKYPTFRAIRGDGNCFFSGFTVSLLEHLVKTKQVHTFVDFLMSHNEWDSPGKEVVIDLLMKLSEYPSQLENEVAINRKILCCIHYFRNIAAAHMKANEYQYAAFLETDIDTYTEENVKQMGESAEHHAILALCEALRFPIRIHDVGVDYDASGNLNAEGTVLGHVGMPPLATLCRNGEHYFVLYPN